SIKTTTKFEFELCETPEKNDALLGKLSPDSLIINATGLGKDRPGSPLTDEAVFPHNSIVWELNYRGELDFMHQALKQKDEEQLKVEDDWEYFIHGLKQVMAEVFDVDIAPKFSKNKQFENDFRSQGK